MKKSQRPMGRENSKPARKHTPAPAAPPRRPELDIDWDEVDRILNEKSDARDEEALPAQVEMPEGIKKLQQLYLGRPLE